MRFGPLLVGCAIALAVAGALWFLQKPKWKPIRQTLSDGTILTLTTVTYGGDHRYSDNPLKDKLLSLLPRPLKSFIKAPPATTRFRTAPNTLVLWMIIDSSVARSTNIFNPQQNRFWATDDHGCLFLASHWTSSGPPSRKVVGAAFDAFPRNQRHFSVGGGSANVVFLITNVPNLFFTPGKPWQPRPLPQKLTNSNLAVELRRLDMQERHDLPRGAPNLWSQPYIQFVNPSDELLWRAGPVFFCDPHGNHSHQQLCTNEATWEIEAHFFRKASATFAPGETWSITNIPIPRPGALTRINKTNSLNGCFVKLLTLRGAKSELTIITSQTDGFRKVLVRATDNLGQKVIAVEGWDDREFSPNRIFTDSIQTFDLYPSTNSSSINLEVLVQKSVAFHFFATPAKPLLP